MNIATKICKDNQHTAVFVLIIWFTACICGMCCCAILEGSAYSDIAEYVETTVSGRKGLWNIIQNGLVENLKFLIFIIVSSSHTLLIPLSLSAMAFKGFSAGFTATILIRFYRLSGVFMCFATVVVPLTLSLFVCVAIVVMAVRFPFSLKDKRVMHLGKEKRNLWFSYVLMQLGLGALLCAVTLFEAIASQLTFSLVG